MSLDQRAYADYLSGLPDPAAIFKLGISPLEGAAVLEISPAIAFSWLSSMDHGLYTAYLGMRARQRALDVALDGDGFLAVQTARGERYTRDGSLKVDGADSL